MTPERLEALYRSYGHAVHRRCRKLLRSEAEADDALQEVFVRVHRYGMQADLQSELGWLYRIADRCCFDAIAKRRRQPPLPEPVSATNALELGAAIREALEACPEELREAGVLYFLDEMTQHEVADTLGVGRKVVRRRIEAFRQILSRFLGPEEVRA